MDKIITEFLNEGKVEKRKTVIFDYNLVSIS